MSVEISTFDVCDFDRVVKACASLRGVPENDDDLRKEVWIKIDQAIARNQDHIIIDFYESWRVGPFEYCTNEYPTFASIKLFK